MRLIFIKFELLREFVKIPVIFIYEIMEEKGKLVIRENDVAAAISILGIEVA